MPVKVLLVDDDAGVLETLARVLEMEGLQVTTSPSAANAVERLARSDFDLVITDMRMEARNAGCQVIKAAARHPTRPVVVVLTAFPISVSELRTMGAATVLLKGTSPGLLLQGIRNIVSAIQTNATVAAPSC